MFTKFSMLMLLKVWKYYSNSCIFSKQTGLLVAAAKSGKIVNIERTIHGLKSMSYAVDKVLQSGNKMYLLLKEAVCSDIRG